jgi:hypothetical protein
MWVNPDAASATPIQLALIAAAGPIFSLTVGVISWLLYKKKMYKWKPVGFFFLMMAMVGIYSFLGPVAGAAVGGDFNIALAFLGIPRIIQVGASATGLVLLSLFMFFIGRELSWWAPHSFGRTKNVVYTTVAPWLVGTVFILLIYWPLPRFLIASTLFSSVFWVFAVMGATFGFSRRGTAHPTPSLTGPDLIVIVAALIMVRVLTHGIRLAH